jgi:predicted AAA+ superfamily ATPase
LRQPSLIGEGLTSPNQIVVIDEIQKMPSLLDEVHRQIESQKIRFLLTGSSARKLKRGAANLLAGRAWTAEMFPLNSQEIPDFNLLQYLNRGGLPHIYPSDDYREELNQYVSVYLKEEIQAESLTRNLPAFVRFLDTLGLANGEEIHFQNIANDSGVSPRTVENYISVLEDTLVGFKLEPFTKTRLRKAITRAKFYFFDVGVSNHLARRGEVLSHSKAFGSCFEQFIICEIRAYLSYRRLREPLQYWRSTSQFEVDCIVGTKLAVEMKSTDLANPKHLKGLRALKEENLIDRYMLVSLDPSRRKTDDGIEIIPWQDFLGDLWSDRLF